MADSAMGRSDEEVSGSAVLAIITGTPPDRVGDVLSILEEQGIESPDEDCTYSHDAFLEALVTVGEEFGPMSFQDIAEALPSHIDGISTITSITDGLEALPTIYETIDANGDSFSFTIESNSDHSRSITCTTPYPCAFDRAIVEAVVTAGAERDDQRSPQVQVTEHNCEDPLTVEGMPECTFQVSWSVIDADTRLDLALEATDTGVWELNLETGVRHWDDHTERLFEYEPGEYDGTYEGFIDRVHDDDILALKDALAEAKETGTYKADYRIVNDGEIKRWVQAHAEVQEEADAMVGVVTDITDRKERETELRRFRNAVEHAGHSVLITDPSGTIEYVNPAFEEDTGYTASEIIGEDPEILSSGVHDDEFYRDMWETISNGKVWTGEVINETKNGDQITIDQTIAPITDASGNIEAYVSINRDITERRNYRERLEDQNEQLRLLNRLVRHDIRNEMGLISGWTDQLAENGSGKDNVAYEVIQEGTANVTELTRYVGDLMQVMMTDDDEVGALPLNGPIRRQVQEIDEAHDDATIEIEGSIPEVSVRANEMLSSVFRNLLTNAINHNDKDEPEVTVTATRDGSMAVVHVADNGPGIDEQRKQTIFADGEKGINSDGSGLGLYLVQTLVDQFGGTVGVEDNDPEGSVFVVSLPIIED